MKHAPRKTPPAGLGALIGAFGLLGLSALIPLGLYLLTGYLPLLATACVVVLPLLVNLCLLPGKKRAPAPEGETPAKKRPLKDFFARHITAVIAILIAALGFGLHLVFWKVQPVREIQNFTFLLPVVLGALFVLCIVFEKWCKYAAAEADRYHSCLLKNLRSALALSQAAMAVSAVAITLRLLGLFDPTVILQVILGILFVYESVFLAFALAVRLIRKEVRTAPEFLIPMPGIDLGDMHILEYLEHNTGITMRSLWSMQFVKRELPIAAVCILVVLWLSTGVVQIGAHQQGALYRLGRLSDEPLSPGLHFTLPFPFDKVDVYDTGSVKKISIGYVPNETSDNFWTEAHGTEEYLLLLGGGDEVVSINLEVAYKISDLSAYIRSTASPEALLQASAYEIVTARTIGTDLDSLLAADRAAFSESFRQELSQRISAHDIGLEIVTVVVESIHPPVQVARIYQRIISAGIDAERMIIEAKGQAETMLTDAHNRYATDVGNAKVQKYQQIADARAAVSTFMSGVSADSTYRDAYRFYRYLDSLTAAYSKATLVIVGEGVDSSNLFLGDIAPEPTEPMVEFEEEIDVGDEYDYEYDENGNLIDNYY